MVLKYQIRLETGEACNITETKYSIEADVSKGEEIFDMHVVLIKQEGDAYFQKLMLKIKKETGIQFYKQLPEL